MRTFLVSLLVGLLVGGWIGYRLADGRCAGDKLAVAVFQINPIPAFVRLKSA